ncbi:hypothetical protein E8E13_007307 [Curvularia kusanoi]|uniref:D-xylulose reductase n=1 Tax=Curvularia kusanoi TaxID=90978 RepID=A0A9P4T9W1_CURKU|nr:hypothetical protein E8E13_007307 [Curvularia kusanoi]
MQNPSIVLYGPHTAKQEDRPIPTLTNPHDVLIRIAYVGVCGSDVHFWNHGGIGRPINPSTGIVMGHEASGTVHSIGSSVTRVAPGSRVAIEPGTPCRLCTFCKAGTYHLCRQMRFAAAPGPPDTPGALCKYYMVPEDMVMGSGTIGLMVAAVAREFGAHRIILVDILAQKLAFAREWLGVETFLASPSLTPEDSAAKLLAQFGLEEPGIDTTGGRVDTVIECSGAASSISTGVHVLRPGGVDV